MRRLLLAAFFSSAAASAASACLNDVTIKGSEREFRSQYQTAPPAPPSAPDTSDFDQRFLVRGGIGAVLLVAAVALTLRRSAVA